MTLSPIELPEAQLEQYGTIVNNEPDLSPEQREWETKAEALVKPLTAKIRLTPSQTVRLNRIATDRGVNIDELINQAVAQLVDSNIGAPAISGPSWAKDSVKVSGFSNSVSRG